MSAKLIESTRVGFIVVAVSEVDGFFEVKKAIKP